MRESKLVTQITGLSKKEREKFRQFVISPYFNQHQKTRRLLDIILQEIDRKKPKLEKEAVFSRLFPQEPYEEQALHNLMSGLKKLFHRFLAQQYLEEQPYQEELYTLEWAFERNQFDLLINRSKQLTKHLDKNPAKDRNYHYALYRMKGLTGYYDAQYVDRSNSTPLQEMMDHLDRFYILEKLRNSCHLTANMILMNTHFDLPFLDQIMDYLEANTDKFHDELSIELYYTVIKSMRDDKNADHFLRLKEILANDLHRLSADERHDLYNFSYNYCIRRINQGDSEYQKELFQLYQNGLTSGLLLNNGILSEWDYKNITTLGSSLREFEWTASFIEEYRSMLPAHRQENAYNYNLANLYYNKKMYHEALSALLHVQFTDVKYYLNSNFLLLRTYYALNDTEALISLIDTFRIYVIRNKKITTDQKKGYTNFLRFARKLVLLKHNADTYTRENLEAKLAKLARSIEESDNVINRYWLLSECRQKEMAG